MCHSGPLSFSFHFSPFFQERLQFLIFTSLSSRISTIFTLNSSSQFLPTIFSLISTVLQRSSQVYLAIQPLFIYSHFLLGTQSPRSSQIFHRSFKDLSKSSFLHPFLPGTWTVGHSGPLSSFPQIFTDLHRFILPFTPYLSIFVYPSLYLQDLHRSSTDLLQIFQRSFKNFPSFIPFH